MNDTRVGIVGDSRSLESIAETVDTAGWEPLVEAPRADPSIVIAVGDAALYSLVPDAPAPVLPVETGPAINSIEREDIQTVLSSLLEGTNATPQTETVTHPVLSVTGDNTDAVHAHALIDVLLITAEPARISEYTVESEGEQVTRVRADGVVVATPAGSHGYAHAAGGPQLAPETEMGAVVPIAPFAISGDHWVIPLSDIRLTVERDEAPVDLFVDGQRITTASPGDTLTLKPATAIEIVRVRNRGHGLETL